MKGALGFTGSARAACSMEASKADRASWGSQSTSSWRRAERGRRLCCLGGEPEIMLNHCTTLLIYYIPPGAHRPPGMRHLLTADSTALACSSLPRERMC